MTNTDKFMLTMADRNTAIFRLYEAGKSVDEIAASLGIRALIVRNVLNLG